MRFFTSRDSSKARDNNRDEIESTMKGLVQVTWEDNEFLANPPHSEDIALNRAPFAVDFSRYFQHRLSDISNVVCTLGVP